MADTVRGVDLLQNELEKAKEGLKDVDESIKKLTGRDPTIQRNAATQQRRVSLGSADSRGIERSESRGGSAANRLFNLARRGIIQDGPGGVKPQPSRGGAFARLGPRPMDRDRGLRRRRGQDSGDEDDLPSRPTLQSSVIATPKEERSRHVSMQEQSKDRKGQARNRRMFGLLLGTLQKFKEDAAETKDKEEQRIKIEKKLDEKFKQEKEDIKNERRQLFLARKQKQFRIRLIEQKMEMVANHEDWEKETRKLNNFLRTKAKPHIFFMPKIEFGDMDVKLRETEKAVDEMIAQRRKKLEEEIAQMMSQVQGNEDDEDDDDVGGDENMANDDDEDDDKMGDEEGEEMKIGERDERQGDNKENDDFVSERERRDKERKEMDRERQMRDKAREERNRKRERNESGVEDKDNEEKSRSRDRSREQNRVKREKTGERERGRDKSRDKKRDRSDGGRDKSRDKDRHRSGKSRRESRRDSDDERSHKHSSSKSKRRSKGEGKAERKEKVWEPMEDEEEEEFMGGAKDNDNKETSLASKMFQLAGMPDMAKEVAGENDDTNDSEIQIQETLVSQSMISLEDIPRPPEEESTENTGETSP